MKYRYCYGDIVALLLILLNISILLLVLLWNWWQFSAPRFQISYEVN